MAVKQISQWNIYLRRKTGLKIKPDREFNMYIAHRYGNPVSNFLFIHNIKLW